jgi:hypothetical protein
VIFATPRRPLAAAVTLAGALAGTVAMAGPSHADSAPSSGKHAFTDIGHGTQLTVDGENVTLKPSGEQIEIQDDGDGKRILKTDDGKCFANHSETLKAQECMDKGDEDRKEQEWKLEDVGGAYRLKNQNLYVRVDQGGEKIRLDKGAEYASVFSLGGPGAQQHHDQGPAQSSDTVDKSMKVRLLDSGNFNELGAHGTNVRSTKGDGSFAKDFTIEDAAGGRKVKLADQNYCLEHDGGLITTSECRRADDPDASRQHMLFEPVPLQNGVEGYRIKNGDAWLVNQPDGSVSWTTDQDKATKFTITDANGGIKKLAPSVFAGG